ncbi:MAG: hypothetical protein M3R57_07610 [Chloroflexota bacterium]|nr:hypothetical protein [Chloroflexota bacterium]
MATTDSRTGFRLPWGADQRPPTDEATEAAPAGGEAKEATNGEWPGQTPAAEAAPEGNHTMSEAPAGAATTGEGDRAPSSGGKSPAATRRTNKFLADLTKAMQVAAESAREETMGRLQAEAKTSVEQIHERSATEAANLRRQADDDVASIREWSKAEIARIREETDDRIAQRKARLEQEIEEHAAYLERRIEKVQGRVTGFEMEMAAFFDRLLAEEDPTRFASMAENLPEPPPFDGEGGHEAAASVDDHAGPPARAKKAPVETAAPAQDARSSMAAIQAAAEAAEGTDPIQPVSHAEPEASADAWPANDMIGDSAGAVLTGTDDFAAAEAEAAAAAGASDMTQEIPTIADDALAARLAGLVPGTGDEAPAGSGEAATTQIVVTGLVSVASIASFKRHLGRVPGVQSVGVSSGPEGEFIFAVHHGSEVVLREAIPGLPGFRARVTGGKDSTVEVAAHDPESGA